MHKASPLYEQARRGNALLFSTFYNDENEGKRGYETDSRDLWFLSGLGG